MLLIQLLLVQQLSPHHQGGLSLCSWLAHLILTLPPHPVCKALSLITLQAA